jgi:hypothetical protein
VSPIETTPTGTGGGGSNFLVNVRLFVSGFLFGALVPNTIVGGASFGGGTASAIATLPPISFGAGSTVVQGTSIVLQTDGVVPSTPDALDLQLKGFVTDSTATNVATITANASVPNPVTDTTASLNLSSATWSIVSGVDLSDGGGTLVSAGGGVYIQSFSCIVGWD